MKSFAHNANEITSVEMKTDLIWQIGLAHF